MTRASLLHILDHVGEISEAEVRELEQLATAFPYCQTAHVLLAKAAHDRGSMLAGQRLRRAATYATDRELLRQLLEQPATHTLAASGTEISATVDTSVALAPLSTASALADTAPLAEVAAPEPEADLFAVAPSAVHEAAEPAVSPAPAVLEKQDVPLPAEPDPVVATTAIPAEAEEASKLLPAAPEASNAAPEEASEPLPATVDAPPAAATLAEASETLVAENETASADNQEEALHLEEDLLPPVAPPIRPPAEAGISRFEFGLTEPDPLPLPVYQLPGLEEEAEELPVPAPAPIVTAPFRSDDDVGYALGAGSRFGYDLQPHDGYTLDLPADAFFEPDALLLAHLAAHRPKPAASSLDLINRFLKTQPRIKTPAGVPLPAEEQTDLSVRSTSVGGGLASESLATIMVRQGKIDKAIEIYERLMERQPEKKAYFAAQIQQLQQPSE